MVGENIPQYLDQLYPLFKIHKCTMEQINNKVIPPLMLVHFIFFINSNVQIIYINKFNDID